MLPQTPKSTLFPYTTLFRSLDTNSKNPFPQHLGTDGESWVPCIPADRKSTRLNSSHDQISYAVFCLKKKKGNNRQLLLTQKALSCHDNYARYLIPHSFTISD